MNRLRMVVTLLVVSVWHGFVLAATPTITSFSPTFGPIGTAVTITGTNFNSTLINNVVYFGATKATILSGSATALNVSVPLGATFSPLSVTDLTTGLTAYSSALFVVTFPHGASINSSSIAGQIESPTGNAPAGSAMADIDGDGLPDVVTTSAGNTTISILRNTSAGGSMSFASGIEVPTGAVPTRIAVADLDGDGKLDIVVTNQSSNTISLLRNTSTTGNISFASKADSSTGSVPYGVAITDLDGDGRPDVVVTNNAGSSVSVFRNTSASGSISLASKSNYATGSVPYGVTLADIDGDGKKDIVVSNGGSNTVSVLRNTSTSGNISFAGKVDLPTGKAPFGIRSADIDGDGKLDVVVTNYSDSTMSVLRNTSTVGNVSFGARTNYATGASPISVALTDLDGDGKPDAAISNRGQNAMSVLQNASIIGNVSFVSKIDFTSGTSPNDIVIGDIEGDGKPDVVVANSSGNTVSVFRNNGTVPSIASFAPTSGPMGTTVVVTGWNFNPTAGNNTVFFGATKASVTAASLTSLTVTVPNGATYAPVSVEDMTVGLTACSHAPFVVTFFHGGGIAGSAFTDTVDYPTAYNTRGMAVSDIDGDGKPDLIAVNTFYGNLSVFRNVGTVGHLSFAPKVDCSGVNSSSNAAVADIDGDGKPDLIGMNQSTNAVTVFRNTSTSGAISFAAKADVPTGPGPNDVVVGDINGDGKPDVVTTNSTDSTLAILCNTSTSGNISFASKIIVKTGTQPLGVTLADIDGDGKLDIITANYAAKAVSVFRNRSVSGMVSLAARVDFNSGSVPFDITTADCDGDGLPDVIVSNNIANTFAVFRNTSTYGNVSFATRITFATGNSAKGIAIADLDGDGRPDVAVANSMGRTLSILRNTGSSGSVSFAGKVDFAMGIETWCPAIGDFDGDGRPDIAVSNNSDYFISVIRNIVIVPTISSFTPNSGPIGTNITITGTCFNATADGNVVYFGATRAGVNSASPTSLTVTVQDGALYGPISLTNLATGLTAYSSDAFTATFSGGAGITTSSFVQRIDSAAGTAPWGLAVGDIDGDGKPDVVAAIVANNIVVFRNTSPEGIVAFAPRTIVPLTSNPVELALSDIDGDGKLDIVATKMNSNTISVFRNTSTSGTVSFAGKVDYPTGYYPRNIAISDIDGDGKPDVAVVNINDTTLSVLHNESTVGHVSFASRVNYRTGAYPMCIALSDIDKDGKPEIIVTSNASRTISIFRNTSKSGNIQLAAKVDFSTSSPPYEFAIGDLDGDGKSDVVVSKSGDTISVFRNVSTIGNISLANSVDVRSGNTPYGLALGDIDGDGKPDVVAVNELDTTLSVYRNTSTSGNISLASKVDFRTGINPFNVAIVDIDGDQKPDIVVTNYGSNSISVLHNAILTTGVQATAPVVPKQFSLVQNYPNPFNPATVISYALPYRAHVTLTVYNTLGQKVTELVNAEKGAGSYDVRFDGSSLASGVYLYRIQAGSFVKTKKLVLLK